MKRKEVDKKTIILEATLNSIAKYGLSAPMSKIVKESGVSIGVFYHYFESKDHIIEELYKKVKLRIIEASLSNYNEQLPYFDQFHNIWFNFVDFFIENPNMLILCGQFENAPHLVLNLDDIYYEKTNVLKNFIKKGIIRDLPFSVIFNFSIGVAMQTAKDAINGVIELDKDLMEQIVIVSWDAIKK